MDRGSGVSVNRVELSLSDLLGRTYTDAVCEAYAYTRGVDRRDLVALAGEKVDLFPQWFQERMDDLLDDVGKQVCTGLSTSARGAGSAAFVMATNTDKSPLTGLGFIRIGEDGKAYLTAKSEHYHLSVGHSFPGYRLLQHAEKLGIPNATHNNTRGHATRLMEQELVRVLNGIPKGDQDRLDEAISSKDPHVLNRVVNLETGSLVVEAALKMMLARFYRLDLTSEQPVYQGRIPVVLVLADHGGGKSANYHGTTTLTQILRGMWPDLYERLESSNTMIVEPVRIDDIQDFERAVRKYDAEPYKVAGFFHEIVLMNYGAIKLDAEYLKRTHAICREHDIPIMVDEIQSCIWAPDQFLFREYGLHPDLVSIGKGFPGGEYAASRIVTTPAIDNMGQFGALVTNGQEELASIAYLITLAFVEANSAYIRGVGDYYEAELGALARTYPAVIDRIEGSRHLSGVVFRSGDAVAEFVAYLNDAGIDISAQSYKLDAPPAALTKLPLVSSYKMVDFLISKMREAAARL